MAEEPIRNDAGQFAPLGTTENQATYNRVRAAQIAGDDEEDIDTEPAKEPTGKESQAEYNKIRSQQQHRGGGAQKKIDQLVKQRSMAREEAAQLKTRLEQYERGEQPSAKPAEREPTQEERGVAQRKHDRFHAKLEEARTKHEDFAELQKAGAQIRITPAMQGQLLDLDNGVDVTIYLARHPEIAKDLHRMAPGEVIRKLERISAKLEAEDERTDLAEKIAEKLPKYTPIKPLGGGSTKSSVPLDKMATQADYNRARKAGRTR